MPPDRFVRRSPASIQSLYQPVRGQRVRARQGALLDNIHERIPRWHGHRRVTLELHRPLAPHTGVTLMSCSRVPWC